jgi:hypothetical protein
VRNIGLSNDGDRSPSNWKILDDLPPQISLGHIAACAPDGTASTKPNRKKNSEDRFERRMTASCISSTRRRAIDERDAGSSLLKVSDWPGSQKRFHQSFVSHPLAISAMRASGERA